MNLRKIPTKLAKFHPKNPRIPLKPSDKEYQQLKKSLIKFGSVQPLVWNEKTGYLLSGHQRLSIFLAEGAKEVEVVVVNLDPQQEEELMIAINRISGKWDYPKLATILDELTKIPNFDSESIGFSTPDLSNILDNYLNPQEDNFDFDAALGSIEEPITKKGDLIELGPHKILSGDCSIADDFKLLMGAESADMLDVDLPYNVNYYGGDRPNNKSRPSNHKMWQRIYSDNLSQSDYEAWMRKVFENIKKHLKSGAAIYIWQGHRQIPPLYQILLELGFHVSSIICWLKESAAFSYGDYSFRNEHALYGWLEGKAHYFAGKPGESNVWEVKRDPTKKYIHPTQKPVELAARAIRNSSQRGKIILDCCLGSGSVLIAAESLGRKCYGVEIDPKYCDAIVQRYITYVGKDKVSSEIRQRYVKEV